MFHDLIKTTLERLVRSLPHRLRAFLARQLKQETLSALSLDFKRDLIAQMYLRGSGLEIGALNAPLRLKNCARISYVDCDSLETLRKLYPHLPYIQPPDIIDDGETLKTITDASQDFVVANHFLEHCQDPIGAIKNFLRVLKDKGVVFMAVPDKRFTFDVNRPITTFSHLMQDHLEGPGFSQREHFREAMRDIVGLTDPTEIERHVDRDIAEVGNTHYHVWQPENLLNFLASLKTEAGLDIEIEAYLANQISGEDIFILRKGEMGRDGAQAQASLAEARLSYAARYAGRD